MVSDLIIQHSSLFPFPSKLFTTSRDKSFYLPIYFISQELKHTSQGLGYTFQGLGYTFQDLGRKFTRGGKNFFVAT